MLLNVAGPMRESQVSVDTPPSLEEAPTVVHATGCYFEQSENWIHTQVRSLQEHAPFVLTGTTKNLKDLDWIPPYYETVGRSLPVRAFDNLGLRMLGYRPTRRHQVVQRKGQIIHAHFGPVGLNFLPLAKACDIPLITTFYGYDLSLLPRTKPEWRDRYQPLFEDGALFLVEGSHMKCQLASLGCPEEKIVVQHLGVWVDEFSLNACTRSSDEPLRVLSAGRFKEKKGFPDAIKAFAEFVHNGSRGELTVIGGLKNDEKEQRARKRLQEIARSHEIDSYITFKGFVSHDELLDAFQNNHVLLSPSVEASDGDNEGGAPVTLIEAAATGMPIVSTYHCDIPEVVQHSKTGLLAQEGDTNRLSKHLSDLYEKPGLLEKLGAAARNRVEHEYNARAQGKKLDEIYNKVI